MNIDDRLSLTDDTHILNVEEIPSPCELIMENGLELDKDTAKQIRLWRKTASDIIYKKDNRVLTVVWPCSIHDPKQALDYAKRLKEIEDRYPNLFIVMRTYFEKPRTTIGWKGLINDPNLDASFDIETWLKTARKLLLEINELWLPVSTEFLDEISPQYIWDQITWWAIWARTTESQIHRELASWLSAVIWFKNWTDWTIKIAIDAIWASNKSHHFLSVTKEWKTAIVTSTWNKHTHVILRWGDSGPNYDLESVEKVSLDLEKAWVDTWIMIDASHANSNKDHNNQIKVIKDVAEQIRAWNKNITWVMIESHINAWNQAYTAWVDDPSKLEYGISITDKCVDFETTEEMLEILDDAIEERKTK